MENKYVVVNCCDVLSCIPVTARLSLSSSPDLGVHVHVEESSKLTSKRLHTLGVNTARVRKSCDGFGVQRWTHYSGFGAWGRPRLKMWTVQVEQKEPPRRKADASKDETSSKQNVA